VLPGVYPFINNKRMKHSLILASCLFFVLLTQAQTDSANNFKWPTVSREPDSSLIKLFPNPATQNVFINIKDWDNKARYNFVLLDGKGRPIKNIILLQPQQLIPLRQSYGKGLLWVEVYKEKILIGKEKLYIADKF
jgi:hypothetical protein